MGEVGELTFKDTTLFAEDIALLRPPQWLNDRVMGFYASWLEDQVERGSEICFMYPETVHLISHNDLPIDVLQDILEPLSLQSKRMILMPLNNNDDPSAAGGTHWSLLAFTQDDAMFRHFDSSGGSNASRARKTVLVVPQLLSLSQESGTYEEASCPQQRNGYDCGVYVLAMIEHIARNWKGTPIKSIPADAITPSSITELREEIARIIQRLKA